MSYMCHRTCEFCRFYKNGYCQCDDSPRMLDRVAKYRTACDCYSPHPFPETEKHTKQKENAPRLTGPCTCKNCGAYIPTGKSICLACGTTIDGDIAGHGSVGGSSCGFTTPKPIGPPPAPPLSRKKQNDFPVFPDPVVYSQNYVDIDLDNIQGKVIWIRHNGQRLKVQVDRIFVHAREVD